MSATQIIIITYLTRTKTCICWFFSFFTLRVSFILDDLLHNIIYHYNTTRLVMILYSSTERFCVLFRVHLLFINATRQKWATLHPLKNLNSDVSRDCRQVTMCKSHWANWTCSNRTKLLACMPNDWMWFVGSISNNQSYSFARRAD